MTLTAGLLSDNSTTWTLATNTDYGHHQRTSSQQVVDVVQHLRTDRERDPMSSLTAADAKVHRVTQRGRHDRVQRRRLR